MTENQEERSVEQYLELRRKLTELLIKSSPFRLNCQSCGHDFVIFAFNPIVDGEEIKELNAGYCPYCGNKFYGIVVKKGTRVKTAADDECVDERVRNRRRK